MSNYTIPPYRLRMDPVPSLAELAGITFLRNLEDKPPSKSEAQFFRKQIIPYVAGKAEGHATLHSFAVAAACGTSPERPSYLKDIFSAGGCPGVHATVNGKPMDLEEIAQLHNNPVAAEYIKTQRQAWTRRIHGNDSRF
jgi:hypothetical protein